MKKLSIVILFSVSILFIRSSVCAQDTAPAAAAEQINKTSEQADNLYGKKIQQETLSKKFLRNPDSIAVSKPKKKNCAKHKRIIGKR